MGRQNMSPALSTVGFAGRQEMLGTLALSGAVNVAGCLELSIMATSCTVPL